MDNDLKSSEALKAYARKVLCTDSVTNTLLIRMFDEIIDNAPTVEPKKEIVPVCKVTFDKEQLQEIVDKKVAEMLERPQGEWIYGEDDCGQDGWFCSECGFFVPWYYQYYEKDINFIRDYKVCPHCISEMITYTGKDRDMRGKEE